MMKQNVPSKRYFAAVIVVRIAGSKNKSKLLHPQRFDGWLHAVAQYLVTLNVILLVGGCMVRIPKGME